MIRPHVVRHRADVTRLTAHRPFEDRADAGDALAVALARFAGRSDVVVLGLARGGVPVAQRVAEMLGATFGVLVSHRISVPGIDRVPLGAIVEGSHRVMLDDSAWYIGVPPRVVRNLAAHARVELERCAAVFRDARPLPELRDRVVILVDDGLTNATTMRAAARALRERRPQCVIAAAPVASRAAAADVLGDADVVVTLFADEHIERVSAWYDDFAPVRDEEILALLGLPTCVAVAAAQRIRSDVLRDVSDRIAPIAPADDEDPGIEHRVEVAIDVGAIIGDLGMPERSSWMHDEDTFVRARGLVVLASGGETNRDDYRDRYLAARLRLSGYATLRIDLLTPHEQRIDRDDTSIQRDVPAIAARLTQVCRWATRAGIEGVDRVILVGTGATAAAALTTMAWDTDCVRAIVARDARLELASSALPHVRVPVLLVVGDGDRATLALNHRTMRRLPDASRLVRIPGASGAVDAPGSLGAFSEHVVDWLDRLERDVR